MRNMVDAITQTAQEGLIRISTRGGGARDGALAVESGGAGPKAGPLEVW
jgi:hypothetical protein